MLESEKNSQPEWYKNHYSKISATAIRGNIAHRIMHKAIEKPFRTNLGLEILEVGSNIGEHLQFVFPNFESYLMTDLRENSLSLMEGSNVSFQIADIEKLPFQDESFDRVISTCVFHHLVQPLIAFQELRRVTRIGGSISIFLPHDPGIVYRFLRRITSVRNAKKHGEKEFLDFVHAVEHRNHFLQLKTLLEHSHKKDKIRRQNFPFYINNYNLNAFTVFHIIKNEL